MFANDAVVADLDLVVELDARADHRVLQRTAIDGGVGADIDMVADHDTADLRDVLPTLAAPRQTKAIGADHRASMQDAVAADHTAVVHHHPRMQAAALTDAHLTANVAAAADHRVRADAGAGADDDMRADLSRRVDASGRIDHRRGMDARYNGSCRMQSARSSGKSKVRVGHPEPRTDKIVRTVHTVAQKDCRGPTARQLFAVLGVAEEGQLPRSSALQSADVVDDDARVALEPSTQLCGEHAEFDGHRHRGCESRTYLVSAASALSTLSVMSTLGLR